MKPIPDCVPDALSMIIATAKAVSDDAFIHQKVLLKVMGEFAEDGEFGTHPSDVYLTCWEIACRALGVKDPYENEKARGDKTGLGALRFLDAQKPSDTLGALRFALKASFAGAMLDYTALGRIDVEEELRRYIELKPAIDDSDVLLDALAKAESVMIVANRAGEIALDKPLCEVLTGLGKTVYMSVAAKPVFTLATERDAENASIGAPVQVVNPGSPMFGLSPEQASSEFRALLAAVDVVIAKGGTNYSTMTPSSRDAYFIMKTSQEEIASALSIPTGSGAIVRVSAQGA